MKSNMKRILAGMLMFCLAAAMQSTVYAEEPEMTDLWEEQAADISGNDVWEDLIVIEEMDEIEDVVFEEVYYDSACDHAAAAYDDVAATLFREGQTGGTYCTVCGEELTAPAKTPMLELGQVLKRGMYGENIYAVQQRLSELGYLTAAPDGGYGGYTQAAVTIYQAVQGLESPDGKVGNWTVGKLRKQQNSYSELTYGMNNTAVKLLQTYLKNLGFLPVTPDGVFGGYTYNALCKYQLACGLDVTGTADISTFTSLVLGNGTNFQLLKLGDSGSAVIGLQKCLNKAGYYYGSADGSFDETTQAAVKLFQAFNGLASPDGIVGNWTCSLIFGGKYQTFEEKQQGDSGNLVLVVQKVLQQLNYLEAEPDGTFGDATVSALEAFQESNNLEVNGIADYQTCLKLYSSDAVGVRAMQWGDYGSDVKAVQEKLYELGYLTVAPDGMFGGRTYTAVCAYQAAIGKRIPTGEADAYTIECLMKETGKFRTVTPESSYSEIYALQIQLAKYRMVPGADGIFGSMTETAVKQVQKVAGLTQTGTVDADTMYYIYNYSSFLDNRYSVQGYSSASKWLIFINATTNRMYVYSGSYGNWTLVYNWACSTGKAATPTVIGQFTTSFRGYVFGSGYSCYYFTSFYGPYYMHSTLFSQNTFTDTDPRLGLNLSMGCVRLDINNALWVYKNIPLGTKVVVVN